MALPRVLGSKFVVVGGAVVVVWRQLTTEEAETGLVAVDGLVVVGGKVACCCGSDSKNSCDVSICFRSSQNKDF